MSSGIECLVKHAVKINEAMYIGLDARHTESAVQKQGIQKQGRGW